MQKLFLDVSKKNALLDNHVIGRVGDKELLTVEVTVTENRAPFIFAEQHSVQFKGMNSENEYAADFAEVKKGTNQFYYTFKSKDFSRLGDYKLAYFEISDKSGVITTENFRVEVLGDADVTAEDADNYVNAFNELLSQFNTEFEKYLESKTNDYSALQEIYNELTQAAVKVDTDFAALEKKISDLNIYTKAEIDANFLKVVQRIPENSDLNSYKNEGSFHCPLNATAATVSNSPTTAAFSLSVYKSTSTGCIQIVRGHTINAGEKQWIRRFYSTWGNWLILPTADGTVQANLIAQQASQLQTARTLTLGNSGKSFNGTANVSWSLTEMGALPVAGGTLEGDLTVTKDLTIQGKLAGDSFTGNASTATKLLTARTIKLSGAVTGSANFDGLSDASIETNLDKTVFLNLLHPIGSIYQSAVSTEPSILFGGTWERLKGKVLIGVDESDSDFVAGSTGGSKNLAAHKHIAGENVTNAAVASGAAVVSRTNYTGQVASTTQQLPPYTTVYMWKRTA